jgi:hypothetical protein
MGSPARARGYGKLEPESPDSYVVRQFVRQLAPISGRFPRVSMAVHRR